MEKEIDKFKKIVDEIFENLDKLKDKEGKSIINSKTVKFKSNEEKAAIEKAMEELEEIRLAFLDFQSRIQNFVLFNYMTSLLEQFAEYASNLVEIIVNNIDESKLTTDSLVKYKSIKKLRIQILSSIHNKYGNK